MLPPLSVPVHKERNTELQSSAFPGQARVRPCALESLEQSFQKWPRGCSWPFSPRRLCPFSCHILGRLLSHKASLAGRDGTQSPCSLGSPVDWAGSVDLPWMATGPRGPLPQQAPFTHTLKFLDIIVGENVCFLQVLVRVQGLTHQHLPEGGQEVQGERDIRSNCNSQQLPQEVQQLFLPVGDGARGQDVLALEAQAEMWWACGAQFLLGTHPPQAGQTIAKSCPCPRACPARPGQGGS